MARYDIRCAEHGEMEVVRPISEGGPFLCPVCKEPAERLWTNGADKKMPEESGAAYQAWFNSDETQSKIRSGELTIQGKDSDYVHRREGARPSKVVTYH